MMCENGPIQKTYELNGNASLCDSFCQHHRLHKCRFKIPKVNISQLLKWKGTAFMKISSNFRAVMRDLVRSNSFFLSFFPQGMKGNYNSKSLTVKIVNGLALVWVWILQYNQKRAMKEEEKSFLFPFLYVIMFSKFLQILLDGNLLSLTLFHIFLSACHIPCSFIPGRAGIREF